MRAILGPLDCPEDAKRSKNPAEMDGSFMPRNIYKKTVGFHGLEAELVLGHDWFKFLYWYWLFVDV